MQLPTHPSAEATPTLERPTILLVDDEPNVLRALKRAFRRTGWEILVAESGAEALSLMQQSRVDVVVSDFRMPGMSGVELLRQVKEKWADVQRIMLTGQADQVAIQEAINRSEIYRFITKPWDDTDLMAVISSALEASALARENRRLLQLTLEKNQELAALNTSLEEKVRERTALLSRSKREWEAAFDALDVPLAIVDGEHRVRRANLAWADVPGVRIVEAIGKRCYEVEFGRSEPCPGCPLLEVQQKGGKKVERELRIGERVFQVAVHPWPDAESLAVVTYRDVTDERNAAEWRRRTERLAAVGRLAGGVAHEINNPLSGVLAFAQIMRREGGRSADDLESLKLIEESAVRCKGIVESLLRFAGGPGEASRLPTDLRRVTADTVLLFRAQLKTKSGSKLELAPNPPELPTLLADPHALGQALMDLLTHRLRALPAQGGELHLSIHPEGEGARWELRDNAAPLDLSGLERLSDPEVADSGLGLLFRVVKEHGGRVDVTPLPQGNQFSLHLRSMEAP